MKLPVPDIICIIGTQSNMKLNPLPTDFLMFNYIFKRILPNDWVRKLVKINWLKKLVKIIGRNNWLK